MLYIVIPVYNGWQQTKRCLNALRNSEFTGYTIIVVDHGSNDDTKHLLPRDYPEIIHILGDSSLWWAGATNVGIRHALDNKAKYIMLLNNDFFVQKNTIRNLIAHLQEKGLAIIAPIQKKEATGEVITVSPREFLLFGFAGLKGPSEVSKEMQNQGLINTPLIGGGRGVIIPTDIFKQVGLFDEIDFPHYYADHDFYLRCRQQDIPLYTAINAEVFIDEQQTSVAADPAEMTLKEFVHSLKDRRSHRNIQDLTMLFKKHYPIKKLYFIGLFLSLARYFSIYTFKRMMRILLT